MLGNYEIYETRENHIYQSIKELEILLYDTSLFLEKLNKNDHNDHNDYIHELLNRIIQFMNILKKCPALQGYVKIK